MLMRVPFAFWGTVAGLAEIPPRPPLTRNQVELMQIDTTASGNLPGFRELRISPRSLEEELEAMLKQSKWKTRLLHDIFVETRMIIDAENSADGAGNRTNRAHADDCQWW